MSKAQELEPVVESSTELAKLDEFDQILLGMAEAPIVEDDPDSMSREIVLRLLQASSDEELVLGQATPWGEIQGVPVEIQGFRWRRSEYQEGAPVYVLVAGTRLDTGDPVTLTTGSYNVLAQLSNLARRGSLPGAVWKLVQSDKPSKRGFKPLWLEKVPDADVARLRDLLRPDNPLDAV